MSPTIIKINNKGNNFEHNFNREDLNKGGYIAKVNGKEGKVRIPVIKKQQS